MINPHAKTLRAMKYALKETIRRCHMESHPQYHLYGGRGIHVCPEWRYNFEAFVTDMGIRPEGHTLERVDNDLGYCKDNCVWATRAQQAANRRANKLLTWEGQTHTVSEWERLKGFKPGTLKARVGPLGYSLEVAFSKPVKCGAKSSAYTYRARRKTDPEKITSGQSHPRTAFSTEVVERIRRLHDEGRSLTGIARDLGVSPSTTSSAYRGVKGYSDTRETA